ncbi:MAG: glycosyl hydrolase family 17 protein [Halothiobacillaceae bacterium]
MSSDLMRESNGNWLSPQVAPQVPPVQGQVPVWNAPPVTTENLRQAFGDTLQRRLHGLCFSPYGRQQQPGMRVDDAAIKQRLSIVQPYTRWVRSFSCALGHEAIPRLAHAMGLKTLVGAWLGQDPEKNAEELAGVVKVAQDGHADIVAVGNEVLLRGDLDEEELLDCIAQVRSALPGVPIGYVDAYFVFEKHPRVTQACDVVLANCYPFWEGCPREHALAYMQSMYHSARGAAKGRPVVIAETGWPDRGSAVGGAVANAEGAMRYFIDTQAWARAHGVPMFHFSSFDESWKVEAEGDVGASWGLWNEDEHLKFC